MDRERSESILPPLPKSAKQVATATCFFHIVYCCKLACIKGYNMKKASPAQAVCLSDLGKATFLRIAVATEAERNAELVRALPKCSSVDEVSFMLAIPPSPSESLLSSRGMGVKKKNAQRCSFLISVKPSINGSRA